MSTDPMVVKPSHYTTHPTFKDDCWEYAQHLGNGAEFSAFKYFFRYGQKGDNLLQDTEKGIWYLEKMVDDERLTPVLYDMPELEVIHIEDGGLVEMHKYLTAGRYQALLELSTDFYARYKRDGLYTGYERMQQLADQICMCIMSGIYPDRALDDADELRRLIKALPEQPVEEDPEEDTVQYVVDDSPHVGHLRLEEEDDKAGDMALSLTTCIRGLSISLHISK